MASPIRSIPAPTEKTLARFWGFTSINPDTGCIEWIGYRAPNNYGLFGIGKQGKGASRQYLANRVAWTFLRGPIPPGLHVLHRCDNPPCVNPDHLFLGTVKDNMIDRNTKGRQATGNRNGRRTHPERTARGMTNGKSKLTDDMVREIRQRRAARESGVKIAASLHIGSSTVYAVAARLLWAHVPD